MTEERLLEMLKTPRTVTFIKRGNNERRTIENATISSLGALAAPEQTPVQGLLTVACSEGYRSFYADSVEEVV